MRRIVSLCLMLPLLFSCSNTPNSSSSPNAELTLGEKLEIKAKQFQREASSIVYDFDPTSIKPDKERVVDSNGQKREYTLTEAKEACAGIPLPGNARMVGGIEQHVVIRFEGIKGIGTDEKLTQDGAQFDLWEDGLFSGYCGEKNYYGYWYYEEYETSDRTIMMIDVSKSEKQKFNSYILSDSYEGFGHEFGTIILPEWENFLNYYELVGGYYYPTVGIFFEKLEYSPGKYPSTTLLEWRYFDFCWLYFVDVNLTPKKVADINKVNYTKEIVDNGDNCLLSAEWKGFKTTIKYPVSKR